MNMVVLLIKRTQQKIMVDSFSYQWVGLSPSLQQSDERSVMWFVKGTMTSWWLNQPIWKNMLVKLEIISPNRGENKQYLKPPPRWKIRLEMCEGNKSPETWQVDESSLLATVTASLITPQKSGRLVSPPPKKKTGCVWLYLHLVKSNVWDPKTT